MNLDYEIKLNYYLITLNEIWFLKRLKSTLLLYNYVPHFYWCLESIIYQYYNKDTLIYN